MTKMFVFSMNRSVGFRLFPSQISPKLHRPMSGFSYHKEFDKHADDISILKCGLLTCLFVSPYFYLFIENMRNDHFDMLYNLQKQKFEKLEAKVDEQYAMLNEKMDKQDAKFNEKMDKQDAKLNGN